jgi:membrane protein DedA with SNARE-associated domain
MADNNEYDRKTLVSAAVIFIGFALILYFLPNIMIAVGGENRWLAGAVVAAVLVLPFVGLWLRGRWRRKDR